MFLRVLPLAMVCCLAAVAPVLADPPNVARRPLSFAFDAGGGAPTGFFGATIGYTLPDRDLWTGELGFGLGATGWQVAAQAKKYLPLGDRGWSHLTLQAGPSVGLIGRSLDIAVPHADNVVVDPDRIYWILWLHAGLGWEARFRWGGFIRFALGGMVNVFNTQAALCAGTEGDKIGTGSCTPRHFASGPEVARARVLPWFGFSYGWSL